MYDLHRHFSGSISIPTISRISGKSKKEVAATMTYDENSDRNYEEFFRKFDILNKISWDHKKIESAVYDVLWGVMKEGIKYVEIKFSIQKYLGLFNGDIIEAICWFASNFDKYASIWGVEFDLVLSLTYESNRDMQKEISNSIMDDKVASCIAGIDLVGNENYFDVEFYKPIIRKWRDAGKICMAHAGEINNLNNVKSAIRDLKVDRVCHGLACTNDIDLMKMAKDQNIVFDIGLTSNHLTGVADIKNHPIKFMIDHGCNVTIGTDDPVVFNTQLCKEYLLLENEIGISKKECAKIMDNSVKFSAKNLIKNK